MTYTATPETINERENWDLLPAPVVCEGLQQALTQVLPHRSTDPPTAPVIGGVLLDFRDRWLHVVATDRFSLAVARVATTGTEGMAPWQVLLSREASDDLADVLQRADAEEPVTLDEDWEVDEEYSGPVLTANTRNQHARCDTKARPARFPDWRDLASQAIGDGSQLAGPMPPLDPKLVARWQNLPAPTAFHVRAEDAISSHSQRAVVVTAENFLGLQMPMLSVQGGVLSVQGGAPPWGSRPADWLPTLNGPSTS